MNSSPYWLARWIDEHEIKADWEIDNSFRSEKVVKELIKYNEVFPTTFT